MARLVGSWEALESFTNKGGNQFLQQLSFLLRGSFHFNWKSTIKSSLDRATTGLICRLDSWVVSISLPNGEVVDPPHSLKPVEECFLEQGFEIDGEFLGK